MSDDTIKSNQIVSITQQFVNRENLSAEKVQLYRILMGAATHLLCLISIMSLPNQLICCYPYNYHIINTLDGLQLNSWSLLHHHSLVYFHPSWQIVHAANRTKDTAAEDISVPDKWTVRPRTGHLNLPKRWTVQRHRMAQTSQWVVRLNYKL